MLAAEIRDAAGTAPVAVTGSLRRGEGALRTFLLSAAALRVRGAGIDWTALLPGQPGSTGCQGARASSSPPTPSSTATTG